MSNSQKTIKYIAIAFAVILAVGIVSFIAEVLFTVVSSITGGIANDRASTKNYLSTYSDVKSLDIDNSTGKLTIKTGDYFQVEASDITDSFEAKVTGDGTLKVSDTQDGFQFLWFHIGDFDNSNSRITVYLPSDFMAEDVNINSGAGTVSIESLHAEKLVISAGAGSITGKNLSADQVKVEGGIGSIKLQDVNFSDTDLNCGVGSLNIAGHLSGRNKVECGIGGVNLDLTGNVNDYDIHVQSGIGAVRLNGSKLTENYSTDHNADNSINVDGGIGDVNININE